MKLPQRVDWPDAAARLAVLIPRERLHPRVLEFAGRLSPRTTWGIAFSGGSDSLALLLLVWAHWPGRRRQLKALHFDHRLRGAESRADADFCRLVCKRLGVGFVLGRWTGRPREVSESAAREARLEFFSKKARLIWLGHQQDDIAETMLMRLSRGSGTGGLSAPRPVQAMPKGRVHLRPLLDLKKAEIQAALAAVGVAGRQDSTNAEGFFFRNRIRRDVLPAWSRVAQRDALAGASLSRTLLEEDDIALQAWLTELDLAANPHSLPLAKLSGKPRALSRRALHWWLGQNAPDIRLSRQAFESLLDAIERAEPTRHSLGRDRFAVIRRGVLSCEQPGKKKGRINRPAN
jgi:tRNA(Ile)-lysidine synthase